MKKKIVGLVAAIAMIAVAGCSSDADKINKNLGKRCEQFECQRRIVVTNGITDKVLYDVEGRCSLEVNDALSTADKPTLEIICKQGPGEYKKHFIGLSDNVTFASTQLKSLNASEYRTKFIIKPQNVVPDLDLVTGN